MSFIAPTIRRLIVVTLVCGLSVGMCCSPAAMAATLEGNLPATCGASRSALATNTFRVDRAASRPMVRCGGGLMASRSEIESSNQLAAENDSPRDRSYYATANASRTSATAASFTTPARTLYSFRVCWRV
ncbi:hypothetical protein [Lacipirellula sp.]|uniref:hypothetical protein n=1 Tax=Lacipirellula sp. TaxID=2691419 RepID=UPI003D135F37